MRCPNCLVRREKGKENPIRNYKNDDKVYLVIRYYKCLKCNEKFQTYEEYFGSLQDPKNQLSLFEIEFKNNKTAKSCPKCLNLEGMAFRRLNKIRPSAVIETCTYNMENIRIRVCIQCGFIWRTVERLKIKENYKQIAS